MHGERARHRRPAGERLDLDLEAALRQDRWLDAAGVPSAAVVATIDTAAGRSAIAA
jgi:hypothetical protein